MAVAKIYSDQSRQVNWTVRKNTDATLTINVTDGGAYDISSHTFIAEFFKIGSSTAIITLTQGAGITNGGATGVLTLSLTNTQLNIDVNEYFWKLRTTSPTDYLWLNGVFKINDYVWDGGSDYNVTIALTVSNNTINLELVAASAGGGGTWGSITGTLSNQTDLQTALDGKVNDTGDETIAGVKTFTSDPIIPDEAYGVSWNGSLEPPTKNAVYDKIETLAGGLTGSGTTNEIAYFTGASALGSLPVATYPNLTELSYIKGLRAKPSDTFLYKNFTQSSITGTTIETILDFIYIPANTISASDIVVFDILSTRVGNNQSYSLRIKHNTSNSLVGATQIAINSPTSAQTYCRTLRSLFVRTTSSQLILNANASTDILNTTSTSSSSINFTQDVYILLTCQLGSALDTVTEEVFYCKILRS